MLKQAVLGIFVAAAVLAVGILIGHYGIEKSSPSGPASEDGMGKDVDEIFIEQFLLEVDNKQIQENLR